MSQEETEFHRKEAQDCFNPTWGLLDREARTPREDLEMLNVAHASRYIWGLVGGPREEAIGDWQISRVYAAVGQPSLSLRFAVQALGTYEANDLADLLHVAFEGMARASIMMGDLEAAKTFLLKARASLDALLLDEDERNVYLQQIAETESMLAAR